MSTATTARPTLTLRKPPASIADQYAGAVLAARQAKPQLVAPPAPGQMPNTHPGSDFKTVSPQDLARAGASILPQTVGSSGTAERHAALATIGAGGAIAAPLLFGAGHALMSGEPMDSEHWTDAGKASAEVAAAILAAKGAKGIFTSPTMSNYLVHGIGGAPDSGLAAQTVRKILTAPEKNQLLINALRGAASTELRPTPALPRDAVQ